MVTAATKFRHMRESLSLSREALCILFRNFPVPNIFPSITDIADWETNRAKLPPAIKKALATYGRDHKFIEEQRKHLPKMKFIPIWPIEGNLPEDYKPAFNYYALDRELNCIITDYDTAEELEGFYKPIGRHKPIPLDWEWAVDYFEVFPMKGMKTNKWNCPNCGHPSLSLENDEWKCSHCKTL